jgi:hypothetical protein
MITSPRAGEFMRNGFIAAAALALLLNVAGCKKGGPAEQAGHKIDKLGDNVQDAIISSTLRVARLEIRNGFR